MSSVFGPSPLVPARLRSILRVAGAGRIPVALALSLGAMMFAAAPAAQAVSVEKLFAGNCEFGKESCGNKTGSLIEEPDLVESETEGFRKAGGFVPFGVTDFKLAGQTINVPGVTEGAIEVPEGFLEGGSARFLRTDVPPGIVTNPFGVPQCSEASFTGFEVEPEGTGAEAFSKPPIFTEPNCPPDSVIGVNIVKTVTKNGGGKLVDAKLYGKVYNLEPQNGQSATYGVAIYTGVEPELEIPPASGKRKYKLFTHTIIEGNVEWGSDYHDYFEINKIPAGLIESRLVFYGSREIKKFKTEGEPLLISEPEFGVPTGFIRNPTTCPTAGPATTTSLMVVSDVGQTANKSYTSLVGANECNKLLFEPSFLLAAETKASDAADGITAETKATHPSATEAALGKAETADLREAKVTLPPGMTMNPAAAAGLEACTPAQIGIGTRNEVTCPSRSEIGTVELEVPTLPAGSLFGPIYLGKPASGPITGPPYTIYLDAESSRYGVKVRLKGTVSPNLTTGQLTTTFAENPEAPFNDVIMHFNGGAFAPIANPLTCGTSKASAVFAPFSTEVASVVSGAAVEPSLAIGECVSPQFAAPKLEQSMQVTPATGGAQSNFIFTLKRPQGEQYIEKVATTLPPGLVAKIPAVPLCAEAQANAGTCPATSQIGTVRVGSGSGEPFPFEGRVYLTEHYAGAPYGLSIVVPAVAGPFNLGNVITRAKIEVNPSTAQVTVSGTLPTIVGGIPTRIQSLVMTIDHPSYFLNPTNCGALKGESGLTSTAGATAAISSAFQVEGCSSLPFKPSFKASTSGHPTRLKGASLKVDIAQMPGEANIAQTVTTLPVQLPSRLTTLQKACTEEQGRVNILGCPASSKVGTATAVTPTLPGKMTGPAYIVSQGGHAFPNLDLVLEGDGVRVILVGNTDIKNGITTTTFASNPDVPISSFSLNLPMAANSLLAANGSFCKVPLRMPTTLVGQNGKKVTQKTRISVSGCLPIVRHRVRGRFAYITVKTPQAGRVTVRGAHLKLRVRRVRGARRVTIKVPLNKSGRNALHARHHVKVRVRVGFVPNRRGGAAFTSYATVTFRR